MGVPEGMSLMLGNGSDELIHLVIQACARPDAVVLSPSPSFVMYEMSARFNRCRFVGVPLKADFSLDAPALLAAIDEHRPAVVFISHPNNPTGNLFDRAVVERVLEAAPGVVVIDEAYLPFAQDTWMPELPRRAEHARAADHVEAGTGRHPSWLPRGPSRVDRAVRQGSPAVQRQRADAGGGRPDAREPGRARRAGRHAARGARQARRGAGQDPMAFSPFPSAANFILFRVVHPDHVFAGLKERGILIKNVSRMHPRLEGCLRVTVGTAAENQTFIKALRAVIGTPQ